MGNTIAEKIIKRHLISGQMVTGQEIALKIDQTLTQDATGTMAYLEFETMGIPQVKTEFSIAYVDHNTLQCGFMNADDHQYLQSVAAKYGVRFSRPGNGIWSALASPARPSSAPIPTPLPAAAWECWPSAPAAWTWLLPWAAAHTISICPKCSRWS